MSCFDVNWKGSWHIPPLSVLPSPIKDQSTFMGRSGSDRLHRCPRMCICHCSKAGGRGPVSPCSLDFRGLEDPDGPEEKAVEMLQPVRGQVSQVFGVEAKKAINCSFVFVFWVGFFVFWQALCSLELSRAPKPAVFHQGFNLLRPGAI